MFCRFLIGLACTIGFGKIILAIDNSKGRQQNTKLIFSLFDAGETLALMPVFRALDNRGCDYKILAWKTAERLIVNARLSERLIKFGLIEVPLKPGHLDHRSKVTKKHLSKLLQKLQEETEPQLFISGVVSEQQLQVMTALSKRNTHLVCYYDAFIFNHNPLTKKFHKRCAEMWVPSKHVAKRMQSQGWNWGKIKVVGQPSITSWADPPKPSDKTAILESIEGLDKKKQVILYAGGYGTNYSSAFTGFLEASAKLSEFNIIISLHPKVTGEFEKNLIEQLGLKHVKVLDQTISTIEAAKISSLIVSQHSSVGIQAHFMGLPTIFLDFESSKNKNLIESGIDVIDPTDTDRFIKRASLLMKTSHSISKKSITETIPRNPISLILREIVPRACSKM